MVLEEIVEFGPNNQLVGVLTLPAKLYPNLPTVIFINSGVLHRVGACRISVTLARELSEKGYACLRFDLYGLGDSGFEDTSEKDELQTKPEIKFALDTLEARLGTNHFILHGLCSGARDAFATSVKDERVVGLSMIDGYAYRTSKYYLNKLPDFLKKPSRWLNFITARTKTNQSPNSKDKNSVTEQPVWPDYPAKQSVEDGFIELTARNVQILATFTGSWSDEFNYEKQFEDMYSSVNFTKQLSVNYMPMANHIMTQKPDRQYLAERLTKLCEACSLKP